MSRSPALARFEVYEDTAKEWRWRLRHRNGNIVADSGQGYTSREKALEGIDSVRANATTAQIHALDSEPDGHEDAGIVDENDGDSDSEVGDAP